MSGQILNKFIAHYCDSVTFHWCLFCVATSLYVDRHIDYRFDMLDLSMEDLSLSQLNCLGSSVGDSTCQEHRVSQVQAPHEATLPWDVYCIVLLVSQSYSCNTL